MTFRQARVAIAPRQEPVPVGLLAWFQRRAAAPDGIGRDHPLNRTRSQRNIVDTFECGFLAVIPDPLGRPRTGTDTPARATACRARTDSTPTPAPALPPALSHAGQPLAGGPSHSPSSFMMWNACSTLSRAGCRKPATSIARAWKYSPRPQYCRYTAGPSSAHRSPARVVLGEDEHIRNATSSKSRSVPFAGTQPWSRVPTRPSHCATACASSASPVLVRQLAIAR